MRHLRQSIFLLLIAIIFGVFLLWPISRVLSVGFFGIPDPARPESNNFTFTVT